MAYNVSQDFTNKLYSGESNFRAILTIGENTIDNDQIASISISSPIIDDSKQVFYVGSFISQKITIKFKNMDTIDVHSGDDVDLSIGQYVNNEWVDVPIGKFLVDDLAENYYEKCEITCLDYAIKFKPNIDYSLCFTDGKATIKEILEYICDYFNVEIGDYPTINDNVEIGTYDSTVSGKQWISYIAELKGCNAKIDRLGRLTLQPLKQPSNISINALESASFELGEEFNITKVIFFDAVRNYTYGDDEGNTLFIRQDNPFITDTKVVQNIYDNLCAIKYSVSGKSFDIEDADAHPINVNTIYGETSQDVYTGKNLLQLFTPRSETKNGVTCSISEDGTITLNGTATANSDFTMYYALQTEANQSYTFNQIYISGSATGNVGTYNEDGEHSWHGWDIVRNINSNYRMTNTYATTMNCTTRPIRAFNGVTYSNLKFKLQFIKGSSADYDYEKYVGGIPSPNPDYPQDIVNVSGDNTIKITGKSILKQGDVISTNGSLGLNEGSTSTRNGMNLERMSDQSVNVSGTTTGDPAQIVLGNGKLGTQTWNYSNGYILPQGTYKVVWKLSNSSNVAIMIWKYDENNTYLGSQTIKAYTNTETSGVGTLTVNGKTATCIGINAYQNVTITDVNVKLMVVKNSETDYTYEPYEERLYILNLGENLVEPIELNKIGTYQDYITRNTGKNLYNVDDKVATWSNITSDDGYYITIDVNNTSSSTAYRAFYTDVSNDLKPNTDYWAILEIKGNKSYTGSNSNIEFISNYNDNRRGQFYNGYSFMINNSSLTDGAILKQKITTRDSFDECTTMTRSIVTVPANSSCKLTFRMSIVEEEQNVDDFVYEPYGEKGEWYLKKEIGKWVLDNSYNWTSSGAGVNPDAIAFRLGDNPQISEFNNNKVGYSDMFHIQNGTEWNSDRRIGTATLTGKQMYVRMPKATIPTLNDFKTWVTNHPITVIAPLDTPEYQKITYQPLIEQLNELQNALLFEGINYIIVDTLNEVPTVDIDYFKDSHFSLWSLKTHNYGDFTLDAWDNIDYDLNGEHYLTLNNNTLTYEMTIMGDVESKIPTKQQEVTTNIIGGDDKTNIKKIKTTVDQLNASVDILSQQQTNTQTDVSQLQIDVNGINTTVERIENVEIGKDDTVGLRHRLSQTEQSVEAITNMFQISGGINILRNSAFLLTDDVWEFTDSGVNPYHTDLGSSYNSTLSGTTISVAEIKARSMKIKSKSENITDLKTGGTKYTFNFYHKQDADTTTTIKMYSTENNTVKAFNDIVITGQQPFTNYEVSFVPTYANYTLEIIVASATSIGYAYFYDMMLNSGDKQSWQPASDEIYSTTLSMSRLGLKVYSVGDGTITLLGSDGMSTYETSDGQTLGRLVSQRTVDGDRTRAIITQSVKLSSDITRDDQPKWVETTTKISGNIAKVIYMESGGQ